MFCYDHKVLRRILQLLVEFIFRINNNYLWKTIVDENRLDWEVAADPVCHIPSPVSPESVSIVLDPTALYPKPVIFIIEASLNRIQDRVDKIPLKYLTGLT